jgi:hypothetical protein
MSYPSNQSQCRKLTDSMVSKMEDRAEAYMGVGPCDGCPFTSTCVGPELFGLGHATRQLQDLQMELAATPLMIPRRRASSTG